MTDVETNELPPAHESLVRDYLSTELDPQVGRAEARFRQFLSAQRSAGGTNARQFSRRLPHRFNSWTVGLVGAALAASLAALWAGPSLRPVMSNGSNTVTPVTPVNNMLIERDVQSQTFDDGTYMTEGDQPVHVLRRRDLQRTRWFDQNDKVEGEEVVPQDHVIYVPMKTY